MYTLCTLSKMSKLVLLFVIIKRIERVEISLIGDQTFNLKSSPGTICTSDARAMDFYYQIEHIPSGAMEVCAKIKTFSQISTPETICISVAGKNISNPTFNNR